MKIIKYRITLLEPVLVTSLQGDPNSAVAFDYLPGSTLRGVLIGKYLEHFGSKSIDIRDITQRRLFFNDTTRYLNGYPLDAYDYPSLPVPLSWQREKDNKEEIFDLALEVQDHKKQWQPVSAPFYTQSGENVQLIQPARNIAVHTQRTTRFGRAMPEYRPIDKGQVSRKPIKQLIEDEIPGAVYRYDALASGQSFQATIICDNNDDETILQDLISGYVTLGRSRSGGYGRAVIDQLSNHDSDMDEGEDREDRPKDKLIVTLQSNMLLRDERGQFVVDPEQLRRVLGKHLGVDLKLKDAYLDAEVIGGFNRKWSLPLPQALSIRMGSVIVFEDPNCDQKQLDDLETRGIGERRTEGFGQIIFNLQRIAKMRVIDNNNISKNYSKANITISNTEARRLAELMVKRMLTKQIDERLLAAANFIRIDNPPSNAQISRLRGIVIEELRKETPSPITIRQFIKSIESRSSARRQFERSTINKQPLLSWLKRLLKVDSQGAWTMEDNEWKALLRLSDTEVGARIGDVKANIDDKQRLEYVLRLIDLVLARAAKQRGKEN